MFNLDHELEIITCCLFVGSLVAETNKDGIVDVTHAYNKIINSIKEAEEAAKMADKAANDTLEVRIHTHTTYTASNNSYYYCLVCNVCLCLELKRSEPRSDGRFSEEPQPRAE